MRTGKRSGDKRIVYVVVFIILAVTGIVYRFVFKGNHDGITVLSASQVTDNYGATADTGVAQTSSSPAMISIYICGEVNNPGIYEVEAGTILDIVAKKAGGFTDKAALDHLNLVYRFTDNMSVFIPSEDNLSEGDSVIMRNPAGAAASDNTDNSCININTASKEQLTTLPGIGESTAQSIITYRQEHPFDTIEDIMNVSGIGEAKFQRIKDFICVR